MQNQNFTKMMFGKSQIVLNTSKRVLDMRVLDRVWNLPKTVLFKTLNNPDQTLLADECKNKNQKRWDRKETIFEVVL